MRNRFSLINVSAAVLLCSFVLGGCSAVKSTRVMKAERMIKAEETVKETGNTTSAKPAAPEDVRCFYDEVSRNLKIKWKKAANAVSYEVQYLDRPAVTFNNTECYVRNVEKGSKVIFRIRSVSANNDHSAWIEKTLTVDNAVEAPERAGLRIDGDYVFFIWSPVDNVDGYEVEYRAEGETEAKRVTVKAPGYYIFFKLSEGKKIEYAIRAFKFIGDKKYYSDYGKITYTNPKYNSLNEYGYLTACTFDLDRVKEYAKAKGGKLNSKEYNGRLIVDVSLRDEAQHTLFAAAKRFIKDVGEAFFEGYADGVKENAIDTAVESEHVKEFINKLDEEATKEAKKNAFKRIFFRTKVDTDIHCIYQYKYKDLAPEMVKVVILKTNNKNYLRDFAQVFAKNKQNDGAYKITVRGTEQQFYVRLGENDNYWVLTLYPVHVMDMSDKK